MPGKSDLKKAIARYGADAKATLANPAVSGEPEDQLRAPLMRLFKDQSQSDRKGCRGRAIQPLLDYEPRYKSNLAEHARPC